MRSVTVNLGLTVCGLLFSLTVLEVSIRYWELAPPSDMSFWETNVRDISGEHVDKKTGVDYQYTTNKLGLRRRGEILPKQNNTFRVILIGDSFIYGYGVEDNETLPVKLEKKLQGLHGKNNVEVINFGVPATSPYFYLKYLKKYVITLKPDLIIVGLMDNDYVINNPPNLLNETQIDNILVQWEMNARAEDLSPIANINNTVLWELASVRFLAGTYIKALKGVSWRYTNVRWPGEHFRNNEKCEVTVEKADICKSDFAKSLPTSVKPYFELLRKNGQVESACNCLTSPSELQKSILKEAYKFTVYLIDDDTKAAALSEIKLNLLAFLSMSQFANQANIPLIGFLLPSKDIVKASESKYNNQIFLTTTELHDTVLSFCGKHRIPCWSPLRELRIKEAALSEKNSLFLPRDGHPSAKGHAFLANYLAHKLNENSFGLR